MNPSMLLDFYSTKIIFILKQLNLNVITFQNILWSKIKQTILIIEWNKMKEYTWHLHNKKHGLCIMTIEDKLYKQSMYHSNWLNGKEITYDLRNGKIINEANYKNGYQHGYYRQTTEHGFIETGYMINELPIGLHIKMNSEGRLIRETFYDLNGKIDYSTHY